MTAPTSIAAREGWGADLIAGLTTAVMLVPQAMAYAMLAGLPPIVGLYAASVPLLAYALVGSSRQLAVGPVAMDSLLTAATVGLIAESGSDNYVELAALLALMVGVVQIGLGLVRAGFASNFLSRPVISGFTSAAALIIAASQLKLLFGVELPRTSSVFETLGALAARLGQVHAGTLLLSLAAIAALVLLKRQAPKWPRHLMVVAAGTIAVVALQLDASGVAVVGEVPAGLPTPALPDFDLETLQRLLPGALTISFVAFMEAISVSTKVAEGRGERVSPNREFVALGLANAAAGLFRGYPVAGGFSRTAVAADAGARSKLAGVVTAAFVFLTLGLFTGLLSSVPKAVLGAMIVTAVVGLIDVAEARRLWRVKRTDLALMMLTFAATLGIGIQEGIAVGVGASLLLLVIRTTRPHTAVLGRLPGTEVYRNLSRYPEAERIPGVLIVRLDAQLYFGNVTFLRDALARLEADPEARGEGPLRRIVLDASGINQLDASAELALHELYERYSARGIDFVLASVKGPVRDVLRRSGLMEKLGAKGMVFRVHDALSST